MAPVRPILIGLYDLRGGGGKVSSVISPVDRTARLHCELCPSNQWYYWLNGHAMGCLALSTSVVNSITSGLDSFDIIRVYQVTW